MNILKKNKEYDRLYILRCKLIKEPTKKYLLDKVEHELEKFHIQYCHDMLKITLIKNQIK